MPCSFRLRTKTPDNKWEDIPLPDLFEEQEFEDSLFDGLDLDGFLALESVPDGSGGSSFNLKAKFKGFEPQPITGDELLDGLEYTETERTVEQVVIGTAPNTVTIDRMVDNPPV